LQQHRRNQGRNDHQVDYDNDSLHLYLPSQTNSAELRLLRGLRALKWRGVTRLEGGLSPPPRLSVS
jgi:hypothetical protein